MNRAPKFRMSESHHTTKSPSAANTERHSASPLPPRSSKLGSTSSVLITRAPAVGSDLGGAVDRSVVHHQDLVDERSALDQLALDQRHDRADRVLLVACGQADRDSGVVFGLDQARQIEVAVVKGADDGAGTRHRPLQGGDTARRARLIPSAPISGNSHATSPHRAAPVQVEPGCEGSEGGGRYAAAPMSVIVRVPTTLRPATGGASEVRGRGQDPR